MPRVYALLLVLKTKKAPEGAFLTVLTYVSLFKDYSSEKPALSNAARLSVACSAEGPCSSPSRCF